jgi:hypothetical protein
VAEITRKDSINAYACPKKRALPRDRSQARPEPPNNGGSVLKKLFVRFVNLLTAVRRRHLHLQNLELRMNGLRDGSTMPAFDRNY